MEEVAEKYNHDFEKIVEECEKYWVIFFISDLQGFIDGVELSNGKSVGGIPSIIDAIKNRCNQLMGGGEFVGERIPDDIFICLGGNMLKDFSSRLVHQESAHNVWKYIIDEFNKIKYDVDKIPNITYVYGNHEYKDFRKKFEEITKVDPEKGCTRNVEWAAKPQSESFFPKPSSISGHCCLDMGVEIPSCSTHTSYENDGILMKIIGLVEQHENKDIEIPPYKIRRTNDCINKILPKCFTNTNNKETNKKTIFLHLAHYDDKENPLLRPEQINCSEDGFGVWWANRKHRPHFILKGHDHSISENRDLRKKKYAVDFEKRYDYINVRNDRKEWVPTFSAGSNGRCIGELSLFINEKEVNYNWQTFTVGVSKPSEKLFENIISYEPHYIIKDTDFPKFGGSTNNADELFVAVCLMLNGMLHRYNTDKQNHIAVALPSSILTDCFVPNNACVPHTFENSDKLFKPFEPLMDDKLKLALRNRTINIEGIKEKIERRWKNKIDDWDLRHVYGQGSTIHVFDIKVIDEFEKSLTAALLNLRLGEPLIIPPIYPESGYDPEDIRFSDDSGSLYRVSKSICMKFKDMVYLLTVPNKIVVDYAVRYNDDVPIDDPKVMDELQNHIRIYEINYDSSDHHYYRTQIDNTIHKFLQELSKEFGMPFYVTMVSFCRKLFKWTGRSDINPSRINETLLSKSFEKKYKKKPPLSKVIQTYLKEKGSKEKFWTTVMR